MFDVGTRSSLGSTELSNADLCDRLVWYHDIRRLVPLSGKRGAKLGSLLHVGLRYWYAQFLVTGLPRWFTETDLYHALDQTGRGYPKLVEEVKGIIERYIRRWGEIDRAWRVLAIEEEYSIRLGDLFGIQADWPLAWQEQRAHELGLTHPRIGIIVARGDLEERPSIRLDIALERSDGIQQIMDYKSTIGQWGRLSNWSRNNEYGLMWQPYEYSYIARHVRHPDGSLVFPNLAGFIIQRILTKPPEDPNESIISDRNSIEFTDWVYQLVPYLIARQIAHRAMVRSHVGEHLALTPDGGPFPVGLVTGRCMTRYGLCDYFNACRSENPEAIISSQFHVEGDDALASSLSSMGLPNVVVAPVPTDIDAVSALLATLPGLRKTT